MGGHLQTLAAAEEEGAGRLADAGTAEEFGRQAVTLAVAGSARSETSPVSRR